MESILDSIKQLLGISSEETGFDAELIMHINSVFSTLNHMGVGPSSPFMVMTNEEEWDEFLEDRENIEMVKTYIYMKVKMVFDPPTSATAMNALDTMAKEYEWRLNEICDKGGES